MAKDKRTATPLRRLAAIACTAAYLLGGVEILPEFLAVGALLEGSHAVRMTLGGDQVTVVLSHQRVGSSGNTSANAVHHHGPAARIICLLGQSQATPDHVARFNPVQISESARPIAQTAPERPVCDELATPRDVAEAFAQFHLATETCPTHCSLDSLRLLRSTVLVI